MTIPSPTRHPRDRTGGASAGGGGTRQPARPLREERKGRRRRRLSLLGEGPLSCRARDDSKMETEPATPADDEQTEKLQILSGLSEALHWVRTTQLQIARFAESFVSAAESDAKDFLVPIADGHFLLNAAAQAEKALRRVDRALPEDRVLQLRSLRNVHEHWEQHKDSFASPRLPKTSAGKTFATAFPDAIPWNFK